MRCSLFLPSASDELSHPLVTESLVKMPTLIPWQSPTGHLLSRLHLPHAPGGPPAAPLRAIAPIIVLSTIVVLATGVALLFAGPSSRDTLLPIHKDSFIVW